ncbi:MAG: Clp protease N-terminal domain-containing protein [Acidimicrobiales bacterium]
MFERFTHELRDVVRQSQLHARRLGHAWVGCEHLLLSVAGADGPAAALLRDRGARPDAVETAIVEVVGTAPGDHDDKVALAALGIDLDEVRSAVEATFGSGALDVTTGRRRRSHRLRSRLLGRRVPSRTAAPCLPFTRRAKRCLERSLREALRLKHQSIGVEHLTLALLADDDTVAWEVLVRLGVDLGDLRRAIEEPFGRTA